MEITKDKYIEIIRYLTKTNEVTIPNIQDKFSLPYQRIRKLFQVLEEKNVIAYKDGILYTWLDEYKSEKAIDICADIFQNLDIFFMEEDNFTFNFYFDDDDMDDDDYDEKSNLVIRSARELREAKNKYNALLQDCYLRYHHEQESAMPNKKRKHR